MRLVVLNFFVTFLFVGFSTAKALDYDKYVCDELGVMVYSLINLQCSKSGDLSTITECSDFNQSSLHCTIGEQSPSVFTVDFSMSSSDIPARMLEPTKAILTESYIEEQTESIGKSLITVKCINSISNKWFCGHSIFSLNMNGLTEVNFEKYNRLLEELSRRAEKLVSAI